MYQLIPPAPSPPPPLPPPPPSAVWAKFQPDVPNPFVLIYVGVYTGVYKNIIKSILSVFWIWPNSYGRDLDSSSFNFEAGQCVNVPALIYVMFYIAFYH